MIFGGSVDSFHRTKTLAELEEKRSKTREFHQLTGALKSETAGGFEPPADSNFADSAKSFMLAATVPQPDSIGQDSALKFLDLIFSTISGGFIEFRYFGAGQKPKVVDQSTYLPLPMDRDRVAVEVLARNGRQMITVGPAPRCRVPPKGHEGKDQDVLEVGCIWADLDYKHAKEGAIEVVERIRAFPLRPSIVVNSGYGRHIYFVFHSSFRDRDGTLSVWKELICGLRDVLHGDAVINPSRVMRLPGTFNLKEEQPVPCELCEELSSWTRYSVEEVRAAIGAAKSSAEAPAAASQEVRPPSPALTDLRRRGVPESVLRSIVTGERRIRTGVNAGRSDDESGRDFWIATTLCEKGLSDNEIAAIFNAHPNGCGSKVAQKKHGEQYLALTLRKARARYEEKESKAKAGRRKTEADRDSEDGGESLRDYLPPGYEFDEQGQILFIPPIAEDDRKSLKPVKVCDSYIYIDEIQENIDTGQISLTIGYRYLDRPRKTNILRSQMAESRQLVAALSGEGAPITSNNSRLVISYLAAYEHAFASLIPRKKVTSRFGRGRANNLLFLPGLSAEVEFAPSGAGDSSLYRAYSSRRGSLLEWVDVMRAINAAVLMIPQIVVLTAFVPPLQSKLQIPNFILDIHGNTTTGKSTSLKLAASVYGNPDDKHPDSLILQWTNTKVAIEQIASMCGDLPVFLDDAQHTPDDLKKTVIYMIANGRGKGRGARGGGIRETPTWRTVALSTSEEPLHESSPHEGARGRLLPIGGLTPPFPASSGTFVQSLEAAVIAHHGYAGQAYIRHLNGLAGHDWSELQRRYAIIRTAMVKNASSDIVGRVSGYIAAIRLAAEIACPLLGLPFKPDVAAEWLTLHLDEQQREQNTVSHALRILADHYISNTVLFPSVMKSNQPGVDGTRETQTGASSMRRDLQGAVKHREYVAFTRSAIDLVFQKRKWSSTAVLNKLAEAGAILSTEKDRHTKKVSVDGIQHRMVCIKWASLLPGDMMNQDD